MRRVKKYMKTETYSFEEICGFYEKLHIWLDQIIQTDCPKMCSKCCESDAIWMGLPELLMMRKFATPVPKKYGCPYRGNLGGCLVHEHRPIICRLFGPSQYKDKVINTLAVYVKENEHVIAGPGVCGFVDMKTSCDIEEVNQVVSMFSELSSTGLVVVGKCKDTHTQANLEYVCSELQKKSEHLIYCQDGEPGIYGK